MRKIGIGISVLIILVVAVIFWKWPVVSAWAGIEQPVATPAQENVVYEEPVRASNEVNAEGRLVPIQYVEMGFQTGGVIQELYAQEGQSVRGGDVLARLHNQENTLVDISSAKLEVANATKAVNDLINNAALTAAQTEYDLVQAQKDLRSAQAKRNALDVPRASEDSLELAQLKYDNAQKELDRIQKEYNSSDINGRKTLIEALEVAKKARNDALSNLNYKLGKPSETDYSEADAYLHYLEQQVADLQRKLTIYQAGPDPDELGIAQARLENANNQLAAAEAALADLEIKAPFDGVVVNLTMKVGQYMSPGEVCLTLADFSKWAIKTTNLTELNVLNIHIGSPAEIRFDALPGETFTGTVTYINPLGESQQGDITYTAMISLDKTDARLRWNMTAPVVIQTK